MAHLLDNIRAADVVFDTEELQALNTALAAITIQGERQAPAVLAVSGVDAPP
jgi:DNA-binding IclR family transcriptional regulator